MGGVRVCAFMNPRPKLLCIIAGAIVGFGSVHEKKKEKKKKGFPKYSKYKFTLEAPSGFLFPRVKGCGMNTERSPHAEKIWSECEQTHTHARVRLYQTNNRPRADINTTTMQESKRRLVSPSSLCASRPLTRRPPQPQLLSVAPATFKASQLACYRQ